MCLTKLAHLSLLPPQSAVVPGASASILRRIVDLYTRLPYPILDPSRTYLDNPRLTTITAVERVMTHWYFKPTDHQKVYFRQGATQHLRNSEFTRWVSLVGKSIIGSFLTGDVTRKQFHNTCIEDIEGSLKRELALDLAPHEMCDRRRAWVHVSLMKTLLIHSSNTYQLLRRVTPAFLQVAYSNPTLWSSDSDLTRIPLLRLLASGSHELAYFVLIDSTFALASGLRQHAEYDTTIHPRPSNPSLHQWAPGSPIDLLSVLADINACRDKSPAARHWKEIEQQLLTWQSRPSEHAFTESWMTIAWYAVQESWRLSLLIYLYLAVCDAPSDDPRIQAYVKQILQVVRTLKEPGASDANASLFSQYLMVGICARRESHRKIAREKLAHANETKFWLRVIRASDFVPVLDHLWHGAAAGGRPVRWSDYVHSREAVFPVAL
ncbi:unnamed protein product [Rhizoctonia solani]|uniref:Uncharacterized protein n=1 Tax=Rhizoctonia solani TaxID=456999 RepID=A0A8H3B0Y7_9AGAM|nr:unnamed protein product [Rhizoctonia solani]